DGNLPEHRAARQQRYVDHRPIWDPVVGGRLLLGPYCKGESRDQRLRATRQCHGLAFARDGACDRLWGEKALQDERRRQPGLRHDVASRIPDTPCKSAPWKKATAAAGLSRRWAARSTMASSTVYRSV